MAFRRQKEREKLKETIKEILEDNGRTSFKMLLWEIGNRLAKDYTTHELGQLMRSFRNEFERHKICGCIYYEIKKDL